MGEIQEKGQINKSKQGWPGGKKTFWLFFAFVGFSVLFFTYLFEPSPKANLSSTQDYNIPDMSKVLITTSMEKRGAFLLINTQVKNNSDEVLKRDIEIYVLDNNGNKYFADAAHVNLEAGQTGMMESKKRVMQIKGPEPHTVLTAWR